MNWRRLIGQRDDRPDPPARPERTVVVGNGGVVAAGRAVVESRRDLRRARADVDAYTGEVRRMLGGEL